MEIIRVKKLYILENLYEEKRKHNEDVLLWSSIHCIGLHYLLPYHFPSHHKTITIIGRESCILRSLPTSYHDGWKTFCEYYQPKIIFHQNYYDGIRSSWNCIWICLLQKLKTKQQKHRIPYHVRIRVSLGLGIGLGLRLGLVSIWVLDTVGFGLVLGWLGFSIMGWVVL